MKLKTVFIIVAVALFGYLVVSNIMSFKKLTKISAKSKMTTRKFAYKNIFVDTSRFSDTLTFYTADKTRDSIGGYVVDKKYNLVVYKISNLENKLSNVDSIISFVKSTKIEPSGDEVYNSSYKTDLYRFSFLFNKPNLIKSLTLRYNGDVIKKSISHPDYMGIYLTNLSAIAAFSEEKNPVEFMIKKRSFLKADFSLEIAVFKIGDAFYFAALSNIDNSLVMMNESVLKSLIRRKQ